MSCTKSFLSLEWEHHHWRPRVAGAQVLAAQEADMWGKPVYRDYVRCDKQEVCSDDSETHDVLDTHELHHLNFRVVRDIPAVTERPTQR